MPLRAISAKCALYAKLAKTLSSKGSRQIVDLASGDVVQLVRTLPCHGRGREFESGRPRHSFEPLTRNPFGAFPVHFEDWAHFSEGRQEIAGVFASAQAPSAMAGTRSVDSDKTSRLSLVGSCSRTTID